ncbi:hypothetical protein GPUN_2006 [Glaciecola punicea ACAM 611]|uniref:Uncharacterized protein n=1 Tax=Glaciecola punicea ACAM 611 TaxID=1121923 RepID=H5TCU4_9ALTE|nr:hypothetical protein GPUN_2006 [Glaciecola punicea ACAM 611]
MFNLNDIGVAIQLWPASRSAYSTQVDTQTKALLISHYNAAP